MHCEPKRIGIVLARLPREVKDLARAAKDRSISRMLLGAHGPDAI